MIIKVERSNGYFMNLIIKSVEDWISFFEKVDELKGKYGSDMIKKTISNITLLQANCLPNLNEHAEFFGLLYEYNFRDLEALKIFLEKIYPIYCFNRIIESILMAKEKCGITHIACILDNQNQSRKIKIFSNGYGYRKVYFDNNIIPWVQYNFKTNGLDNCFIPSEAEFIVDSRDFVNRKSEFNSRVLCTSDFRMNVFSLPSKDEMDEYDCRQEKYLLFSSLLEGLEEYFLENKVHLIIGEPNQTYFKDNLLYFDRYSTIRTDGIMFDEFARMIQSSNIDLIECSKILVKDANMVVISKVINDDIQDIYLIVQQDFLLNYLDNKRKENSRVCGYLEKLMNYDVKDDYVQKLMLTKKD